MATSVQFLFPNFKYGYLPEYFENGNTQRRINLRPGQWIAVNPAIAPVQNSAYTSRGITHLINNTGGGLDTSIDFLNRAGMDRGDFISKFITEGGLGKPYTNWNLDNGDIKRVVDSYLSELFGGKFGKISFFLDQISEVMKVDTKTWNISQQQVQWAKAVAAKIASQGGRFYGGYDGHLRGLAFAPDADVRKVLNYMSSAVDLAKAFSPFGNDFYTANAYTYRHGCIKIYQTGFTDMHRFVVGFLLTLKIDRMARQELGTDKRVAVAAFSGYMETLNEEGKTWSVRYERTEPSKGTVTRTTFPQWSYSLQLFFYTVALLWDFDLYSWESEERYGSDGKIVDPDYGQYEEDGVVKGKPEFSSGSTFTHAKTVNSYTPNQNVSFPLNPQGGQDIVPVAAELASWLHEWVGNWDTQFAAHQVIGGHGYTVSNLTYLADRFGGRQGICLVGSNGGYRRWVLFCDTNLQPGRTEQVQVNIDGVNTFSFTAYGQTCHAFRIDNVNFVD